MPFLPPKEEYQTYLDGIWRRNWLTNHGPLVNELELRIKEFTDLPHFLFVTNGTTSLQMAIKALQLEGEIITTPFSYVATTTSIIWEGCKPVFVDIQSDSFGIDVGKIEPVITSKTSAILATNVYGNACDIDGVLQVAQKHNLKVIFDSAHCFGTKYKGKSIYAYGDISTASFHATKLFHTIEGGGVFSQDAEVLRKLSLLRSFGHTTQETFEGIGINGKNSEFHAAMGLCNLNYISQILETRKRQWLFYREKLNSLQADFLKPNENCEYNYAYFPVVFHDEKLLQKAVKLLNLNNIFPRRYFSPSLNTLDYVDKFQCPISERVSSSVLCLPLYHTLTIEEQNMIFRLLLRAQNNP